MREYLKTKHARSMNNGIVFYSRRHKNYVTIVTIDEKNTIKTECITKKRYNKNKDKNKSKQEKIEEMKEILIELPFHFIFYTLVILAMMKDSMFGTRTFLIGHTILLVVTFIVSKNREDKNLHKFHAAEHMVLNAYRKLKRVPSLEEVWSYSRFSNSCGTNATTLVVMSYLLIFASSFIPNVLYSFLGMLASTGIVWILIQCGFLNFLQNFNTIIPTDKELIVAITGMNAWLENERKEKN